MQGQKATSCSPDSVSTSTQFVNKEQLDPYWGSSGQSWLISTKYKTMLPSAFNPVPTPIMIGSHYYIFR